MSDGNDEMPEIPEDTGEIPDGLVDPKDVTNDQSGLMFRWKNLLGSGDEKTNNEIVEKWIAQDSSKDWFGRTNISINQAAPIAFLANIDKLLPNATHDSVLANISDEVLEDYLEILTSIEGESRKQQVEVLKDALHSNDENEINIGPSADSNNDE